LWVSVGAGIDRISRNDGDGMLDNDQSQMCVYVLPDCIGTDRTPATNRYSPTINDNDDGSARLDDSGRRFLC